MHLGHRVHKFKDEHIPLSSLLEMPHLMDGKGGITEFETEEKGDSQSTFERVSLLGLSIVGQVQENIFLPWLV